MKDILKISVVNFKSQWGNKEKNTQRIVEYIECAASEGSNMIVFPEMCLTGMADETEKPFHEKMQYRNAEKMDGTAVQLISKAAQNAGIYALIGMPYMDTDDSDKLYNAAGIFYPEGNVDIYKKIHIAQASELSWATKGNQPKMLDTPWGKIGIAICYDVYFFPELIRYYVAKGARMVINLTAYSKRYGLKQAIYPMATYVFTNQIYIAAANLCGLEKDGEYYYGGSCVIGPSNKPFDICYYAGIPFGEEGADEQQMFTTTIDLSLAERGLFQNNLIYDSPDFRADLYAKLYKEVAEELGCKS